MSETPLRIELLGHVRVLDGGAEPLSLPSSRRRALLSYLILHRHAAVPRERLASLFWPDSEEAQARTNLRRELHHLRAEVPHADDLLKVLAETLRWMSNGRASVDVEEFDALLRDAAEARLAEDAGAELRALASAASLYRGDLLPSVLDDWVEPERQRLRAAVLTTLSRLVELHETHGDVGAAIAYAERVVGLEPLDETAYRALMRLNPRTGSRAAAIHAFHRLAGALRRELDLEPSQATRQAYRELLAAGEREEVAVASDTREAVPLVGRDDALASLRDAWAGACSGTRSPGPGAVVVHGETGIGKTRLIEEFVRRVQRHAATVAHARAYAAEGPVSYGVALDWLRTPAVAERIRELPGAWRSELARLAPELDDSSAAERPPPGEDVPAAWHRRRLLEAVAHGLLAAPQPLLLVADDLQWADADSLDALRLVMRLEPRAQVLVVATVRSEELAGNVHLERLLISLRNGGCLRERELGRLGPDDTARLAREVAGESLVPERLERICRLSEGVPLFVVEALRADGETAEGREDDTECVPHAFPPRVRAMLAAHLRQLTPDARQLAELAATVGRAFSFEVLKQATDRSEEQLVRSLDELWRRRIVREQAAGAYDFSHDALRDAAYRETEPARRGLLHRRVTRALESLAGRVGAPPSARVAHHLEQGGEIDRAVDAYARAAREASAVFSHEEAIRLLDRAQTLLGRQPAGRDRDRRELELHLARVTPLRSLGGHAAPALDAAMRRTQTLGERLGDHAVLFQALLSQQITRLVSGRVREALELSEPMHTLTRRVPDWQAE
ncbi:MAG TPA: AAA family ATPase, partial [Trueperaceae bacterium]|nr:AAA family ATPase [Trueperaceae bacterium]